MSNITSYQTGTNKFTDWTDQEMQSTNYLIQSTKTLNPPFLGWNPEKLHLKARKKLVHQLLQVLTGDKVVLSRQ